MPDDTGCQPKGDEESENVYLQSYHSYASNLRTWFVAYGIGAPALLISQEDAWHRISASSRAQTIAILFLAGVALQILLAMLNKNSMWLCYRGDGDDDFSNKPVHRIAEWFSHQYWIDMLFDMSSAVCFVIATYWTYLAILGGVKVSTP